MGCIYVPIRYNSDVITNVSACQGGTHGKKRNNKITKRTIPAGFSVSLALVDLIPVVCFGLSAVRVGSLFSSTLFMVGAGICLTSGVVRVLWKLIAAVSQKNIWSMFVQMRILMPVGFLVMLAALIVDRGNLSGAAIFAGLTDFPACVFFGLGVLGMVLMTILPFGWIPAIQGQTGWSRGSMGLPRCAFLSGCFWCEGQGKYENTLFDWRDNGCG